ncbi:pectinesterase inhibitor 9-like [Pyrus x bretschneideri]|uniref:pectinesterase inhibitor 9-like n=1 Tax=Pyrus x bretschneideri TaxID=225117 RepID=UPI00202E0EBB|nr:pectinesterase inhibitor 9-like [Pyrus x bretschneideri]
MGILPIPTLVFLFSFLSQPIPTFGSPSNETDQLAKEALDVGLTSAQRMVNYLSSIALNDCIEAFGTAAGLIRNSLEQMLLLRSPSSPSFRPEINNVLTWITGAIDDGNTCTEGFKEVAEGPLKTDISNRAEDYKKVIENALALVRKVAEKQAP